ncbi:MAG: NADH-quinone oxidoreductase subunit J [Nitrososphaerales archaeon]|nr:NADH-quinone oxidoreductase subunit J [Nitrososphaerales archaeon]
MADLVFLAMAVVTVGGAMMALEADEIVYGAIGLASSLFGIATFFFLLNAPYVAVFQVTVYIGAVAVLILFTVMLVRQESWAKEVRPTSVTRIAGILTGFAVATALALAAVTSNLSNQTSIKNTADFLQIGRLISTNFSPVLEVLALVLAASVVGALTLTRVDREDEK